jgi:hypothetical protein
MQGFRWSVISTLIVALAVAACDDPMAVVGERPDSRPSIPEAGPLSDPMTELGAMSSSGPEAGPPSALMDVKWVSSATAMPSGSRDGAVAASGSSAPCRQ